MDIAPQLQKYAQQEARFLQQVNSDNDASSSSAALPLLAKGQLRVHDPNPFLPRDLRLKAPVQPRPGGCVYMECCCRGIPSKKKTPTQSNHQTDICFFFPFFKLYIYIYLLFFKKHPRIDTNPPHKMTRKNSPRRASPRPDAVGGRGALARLPQAGPHLREAQGLWHLSGACVVFKRDCIHILYAHT